MSKTTTNLSFSNCNINRNIRNCWPILKILQTYYRCCINCYLFSNQNPIMYRCYYYYYPLLHTILFLCFEKQKIDRKKNGMRMCTEAGPTIWKTESFCTFLLPLGEYQNQLSNFWSADNETFTKPSSNIIIIEEWESTYNASAGNMALIAGVLVCEKYLNPILFRLPTFHFFLYQL